MFSDSLNVVRKTNEGQNTTPEVYHWIVQIGEFCQKLSKIGILDVPRIRNMIADRLTKERPFPKIHLHCGCQIF